MGFFIINKHYMTNKELISHEEDFGPLLYGSKDCLFSHGKGALLYTSDGKEYIDFIAGHGVGNLGHSHPKVVKAIEEQAKKLIVLHSSFPNEQRATLFKKLAEVTPKQITNTFLSNSGTESVEAAIKLAIVSHRQIKKPHILAMKRGFHGRSLGSLALTFGRRYRKPFKTSLGLDVSFASFGDIDDVKANIKDSTVGIITEVVQGEGGIYVAPDEFPKQLREL